MNAVLYYVFGCIFGGIMAFAIYIFEEVQL